MHACIASSGFRLSMRLSLSMRLIVFVLCTHDVLGLNTVRKNDAVTLLLELAVRSRTSG